MSLRLEVGKTYETKDGDREHVVAYVPVNPITGKTNPTPYVAMSQRGEVYRYREDGGFYASGESECHDLIREHVPPPALADVANEFLKRGPWLTKGEYESLSKKFQTALAAEKAKVGQ